MLFGDGAVAAQSHGDSGFAKGFCEPLARRRALACHIDREASCCVPLPVRTSGIDVNTHIDAVLRAELGANSVDVPATERKFGAARSWHLVAWHIDKDEQAERFELWLEQVDDFTAESVLAELLVRRAFPRHVAAVRRAEDDYSVCGFCCDLHVYDTSEVNTFI